MEDAASAVTTEEKPAGLFPVRADEDSDEQEVPDSTVCNDCEGLKRNNDRLHQMPYEGFFGTNDGGLFDRPRPIATTQDESA